jgi:ribose 1,5-bisphosphokinase PhnN
VFALVLTGPPGAGKTSVLEALSDALAGDDIMHAAVEAEALRWAHPGLSDEQEMRHLAAMCALFRDAGHRVLLVGQTIETDADLARLLEAVGADEHLVVRLEAEPATLVERIVARERESWSGLAGLVEHAQELAATMPAVQGVDIVLSTEGQRAESVAERIRAARADRLGPTAPPRPSRGRPLTFG